MFEVKWNFHCEAGCPFRAARALQSLRQTGRHGGMHPAIATPDHGRIAAAQASAIHEQSPTRGREFASSPALLAMTVLNAPGH